MERRKGTGNEGKDPGRVWKGQVGKGRKKVARERREGAREGMEGKEGSNKERRERKGPGRKGR